MIFSGTKPIYIQIHDYIKTLIDTGVFKPGDSLPSVRDFALSNGINPNTVARAYDLLIEESVIVSIPKKGYFVKDKDNKKDLEKLETLLHSLLEEGYTKDEILEILERKDK